MQAIKINICLWNPKTLTKLNICQRSARCPPVERVMLIEHLWSLDRQRTPVYSTSTVSTRRVNSCGEKTGQVRDTWRRGGGRGFRRSDTHFEIVDVCEEEEDEAEGRDPLAYGAGQVEDVVLEKRARWSKTALRGCAGVPAVTAPRSAFATGAPVTTNQSVTNKSAGVVMCGDRPTFSSRSWCNEGCSTRKKKMTAESPIKEGKKKGMTLKQLQGENLRSPFWCRGLKQKDTRQKRQPG